MKMKKAIGSMIGISLASSFANTLPEGSPARLMPTVLGAKFVVDTVQDEFGSKGTKKRKKKHKRKK